MKKQAITTKHLVLTALLAALTVAGSALRVTLPIDIAGTTSFHLGNIMCALSGLLLGPWLGFDRRPPLSGQYSHHRNAGA